MDLLDALPTCAIEERRQASQPLNSFDMEIGSSDKQEQAEHTTAGTPAPSSAARVERIKTNLSFRYAMCPSDGQFAVPTHALHGRLVAMNAEAITKRKSEVFPT